MSNGATNERGVPHDQARSVPKMMASCINALLLNGNPSHRLNLDRIARFQQFDPTEFRAAFLAEETKRSMTPAKYEESGK